MATSSEWHEGYDNLSERALNFSRALKSVQEELEAIDWYNQRAEVTKDEQLRRILEHATAQDDPNAKAKNSDKSQPTADCKPAASNDAQGTNSGSCGAPAAPNTTPDITPNSSQQPKPPYRRTDD